MDHAAVVRGRESRGDLPREVERPVFGEPAHALERGGEVLTVDVFHRDEELCSGACLDLADVVHAAHVRMRDLPRHAHFVVKLGELVGVGADAGGQELDRDRLSESQVVGAIDLAHAAPTEQADDSIAAFEQRAR